MLAQVVDGIEGGAAKIVDVDVVAHAGAVGCCVVVAEEFQRRPLAQCLLEDVGDQVGLGVTLFTQLAVFITDDRLPIYAHPPPLSCFSFRHYPMCAFNASTTLTNVSSTAAVG